MTFVVYNYKTNNSVDEFEDYAKAVSIMHDCNSLAGYKKLSRSWSGSIEQENCIDPDGVKTTGPFVLCHLRYWNDLHHC